MGTEDGRRPVGGDTKLNSGFTVVSPENAVFTRWHGITLVALFVGYAGYYVCRSNLSIVDPADLGLDEVGLGRIFSIGVLLYAIGKVINGIAADFVGGRVLFLFGMFASVVATTVFALGSGWWHFAIVWGVNRFVQSMGWGGLVQVSGRWFRERTLATVMGILAVSYFIGDATARVYLGWLLGRGLEWRGMFFAAAGTLGVIGVGCLLFLKGSPKAVGLLEPEPPKANVFGNDRGAGRPQSVGHLLGPLMGSLMFWLVCALSLGTTMIREAFMNWTKHFLHKEVGMGDASAAQASMIFSLVGAASSILAGWALDRSRGNVGRIMASTMIGLVVALVALATIPVVGRPVLALTLVGIAAFCLLGPYTFCSGVLALSLGGQRGGATAAGLIDSAGYFGAILAGDVLGRIIKQYGWSAMFITLAGVALMTAIAAIAYWMRQRADSELMARFGKP
jgi:MFS transporter, OPA family, glycerol-3-phosphate transporter